MRNRRRNSPISAPNSGYIFTTGTSRITEAIATETHLLHPQHLRSGLTAIQRHMTTPPKPWEMDGNTRRIRVRDACLETWMEQQTGLGRTSPPSHLSPTNRWPVQDRSEPNDDQQVSLTQPIADSRQSSAGQHQADATREITTAARFWWNSVITGRRTNMKLRSGAHTAQHHTLSKGHQCTTMMFDRFCRQAVLGPNTLTLSICRNMAWNQRGSDHFPRFAKAKLLQRTEFV